MSFLGKPGAGGGAAANGGDDGRMSKPGVVYGLRDPKVPNFRLPLGAKPTGNAAAYISGRKAAIDDALRESDDDLTKLAMHIAEKLHYMKGGARGRRYRQRGGAWQDIKNMLVTLVGGAANISVEGFVALASAAKSGAGKAAGAAVSLGSKAASAAMSFGGKAVAGLSSAKERATTAWSIIYDGIRASRTGTAIANIFSQMQTGALSIFSELDGRLAAALTGAYNAATLMNMIKLLLLLSVVASFYGLGLPITTLINSTLRYVISVTPSPSAVYGALLTPAVNYETVTLLGSLAASGFALGVFALTAKVAKSALNITVPAVISVGAAGVSGTALVGDALDARAKLAATSGASTVQTVIVRMCTAIADWIRPGGGAAAAGAEAAAAGADAAAAEAAAAVAAINAAAAVAGAEAAQGAVDAAAANQAAIVIGGAVAAEVAAAAAGGEAAAEAAAAEAGAAAAAAGAAGAEAAAAAAAAGAEAAAAAAAAANNEAMAAIGLIVAAQQGALAPDGAAADAAAADAAVAIATGVAAAHEVPDDEGMGAPARGGAGAAEAAAARGGAGAAGAAGAAGRGMNMGGGYRRRRHVTRKRSQAHRVKASRRRTGGKSRKAGRR